jgi:D-beta-D-heptose 7-phosphate kinase/D-beta-D-heptose 1-phosphate adenosyltransferase
MISNLREVVTLIESGWHQLPVLVLGDVMLDQYVWGDVERISPEAPVPIVRATFRDEKPGGAANVAMNLSRLGACVTLVGFAGSDGEQQRLESLLVRDNIDPVLIRVPGVATTTKLRILSGHQQIMRLDTEAATSFSEADYRHLLENALAALDKVGVVVLSDYAKGVLTDEVCRHIITAARERCIPILVDPKHPNFERYHGATAVCPNLKELSAAIGEPASGLERLLSTAQAQLSSLGLEFMAVTLGEKGIAVLRPNSLCYAPAVVRQVYDVSGAGDTVIAVLALAVATGVEVETAIQLANLAAGIVVSKVGTAPICREELLGALTKEASLHIDEKVLPTDRLMSRLAAWRSVGDRIVFTNGCFDLLHIGHIRLLEQARHKGDRLIVGLNSDNSVRRLKGPSRPVVGECERAQVLAALNSVDAVVIFDESTPLRLIEALRPDVLVKGGDYTEKNVVGAR